LAHEKELARVAEDGGANAAFFETAVLLHDRNIPAIELPHLRVAFFHDLFAARNVEKTRDFLVNISLPQSARHRDDVLSRVVGNQEPRDSAQQLCGFGNVAQLEVSDFAGQRNVARAIQETTVVAVCRILGGTRWLVELRDSSGYHALSLFSPVSLLGDREVGDRAYHWTPAQKGAFRRHIRVATFLLRATKIFPDELTVRE